MFNLNQLLDKRKKFLIFLKSIIIIGILLLINNAPFIKGNSDERENKIQNNPLEVLFSFANIEDSEILNQLGTQIKDQINNVMVFKNKAIFEQDVIKFQENININKPSLYSIEFSFQISGPFLIFKISIKSLDFKEKIEISMERYFMPDGFISYEGCSNSIKQETKIDDKTSKTINCSMGFQKNNDSVNINFEYCFHHLNIDIHHDFNATEKVKLLQKFNKNGCIGAIDEKTLTTKYSNNNFNIDNPNIEEIVEFSQIHYLSDLSTIDWTKDNKKETTKKIKINDTQQIIKEVRFFNSINIIDWKKSFNILNLINMSTNKKDNYIVGFDSEGKISSNSHSQIPRGYNYLTFITKLPYNLLFKTPVDKKDYFFQINEKLFLILNLSKDDLLIECLNSTITPPSKRQFIAKITLKESSKLVELSLQFDVPKLNDIFNLSSIVLNQEQATEVEAIAKELCSQKTELKEIQFEIKLIENEGEQINQLLLMNRNDTNDLIKLPINIKLKPLNEIIKSENILQIKVRNIETLKKTIMQKYPQLNQFDNSFLKIEFVFGKDEALISYDVNNITKSQKYSIDFTKNQPIIIKFNLPPKDEESFLSSVLGFNEVKKEFRYIYDYLNNPSKYDEMKIKIPRGYILYGPPGTGKTHLARALASNFNIPFMNYSGSEFSSKFVGESEKKIREMFALARDKRSPCIIFIDEIDALLSKRGGTSGDDPGTLSHHKVVNQFLSEVDGFKDEEFPIFIIGATNRLDSLDPAVTRSGRLEKHIFIGLPNKEDAKILLKNKLKERKIDSALYDSDNNIKDEFLEYIASKGIDLKFSTADFIKLINQSALSAIDIHNASSNRNDWGVITKDIILQNLDKIQKEKRIIEPYISDKKTIIKQTSLGFIIIGLIIILIWIFLVIYKKISKKRKIQFLESK